MVDDSDIELEGLFDWEDEEEIVDDDSDIELGELSLLTELVCIGFEVVIIGEAVFDVSIGIFGELLVGELLLDDDIEIEEIGWAFSVGEGIFWFPLIVWVYIIIIKEWWYHLN